MRDEAVPGAALFKTAGPGIAWPGAGAQGHPSRGDVMYPVTTEDEARAAVADYVRIKPEFIKIWVDNRGGRVKTLTPPLYRTIVAEAHRYNVPVGVHNVTLADAKELMRAGVEGWLHVPVRGGEAADDELIGIVRDRVATPSLSSPASGGGLGTGLWITPSLHSMWMMASWVSTPRGQHPVWLDDPLLSATYSPEQIARAFTENQKQDPANRAVAQEFELEGRNAMALRAAGMRIVMGTDTGQTRHWIGYYNHMALESFVAIGLTPAEAIVAATRDSAEIAKVNSGLVASGRSADFIVLDANPLESISNSRRINKVYLRGREVPRAAFAARWQSEFGRTASTRESQRRNP
jgi:imidazolonepropionase-like amidohydrolase